MRTCRWYSLGCDECAGQIPKSESCAQDVCDLPCRKHCDSQRVCHDPSQRLDVHDRGSQVSLGVEVGKTASDCTAQAVLRFGSSVDTFHLPAVAAVFFECWLVPAFLFAQ